MPSLEDLEAEIAMLDERRRVTMTLLQAMRDYEASVRRMARADTGVTIEEKQPHRARAAPIMEVTETVAIQLMEETGGPVAIKQVVDEMRRRGIELPDKNTNNVISARLSNNSKFKGQRGRGYWLADRPWPDDTSEGLPEGEADL